MSSKEVIKDESSQLHKTVNEAIKEEGAKVHVFDPDMSAEEKKQQALEQAPQNTLIDALKKEPLPGAFVHEPLNKLPDWYRVGWTGLSSLPNPGDEEAMSHLVKTHTAEQIQELYRGARATNGDEMNDLISQFINEKYYGEWYHNCAVVFVCIFFTWFLIQLRFGLMSCFIVGAFFATYYRTSIKRTRRNARDDIQRQVSLNRMETDTETVHWMNHFLDRFWLIFEPSLSAQIIGQVDAVLSENTPSFLDSIRMSTFTLGTKAPRVDSVKVLTGSAPDTICMDWKFSFIPNDTLDMTERETQSKINPKIVLTIRVGKGMLGAGMPVLLENVAFSGHMRIKLKLFNEMPHVKTAEVSFLEKPHFDYVLKPVGGETFGFDINNIPGLQTFIQDQVHSNLGPMMYAPNVFTLDVAAMMAGGGADLESAQGVLAVTLHSAQGLKPHDLFGSLDPYITFHVDNVNNTELARSSAKENSSNPKWNETHFLLINNLNGILCFHVWDRNTGRGDSDLGVANLDLKDIQENQNAIEGLNLVVLRSGKPVGEIKADVAYFPAAKPEKKEDGSIVPAAESNSGIVRFYVNDCKELGGAVKQKKGGLPIVGGLPVVGAIPVIGSSTTNVNAYAIVKVNGKEKLRTTTFKRSSNPRWNKFIEVFVEDKTHTNFEVIVKNSIDFGDDSIMGRWTSSLIEMENQLVNEKNDWWNLKDGAGKIHLDMNWKPVPLTGFSAALHRGSYQFPVGVVRVKLNHAKGLKNVEALTGGKSDPYVRIMSGLQTRAQTEPILDNLDPIWDTALYVPVHSLREDLVLEVMDWNDIQKDKFLGMHELLLKDLVTEKKSEGQQSIYEALAPIRKTVDLISHERKTGRGQLSYEASFFPTLALAKQADDPVAKEATDNLPKLVDNENDNEKAVEAPSQPEKDLHGEPIRTTANHTIDLLSYESGVLSVTVHHVDLPQKTKAVAEILLDTNDAQFTTSVQKGTQIHFNESGDAFVKEMEFSRLIVSVRKPEDRPEERIGFWTNTVRDIVSQIQKSEKDEYVQDFKLLGCAGNATIRLAFKFVPVVQFKLDKSESLENQGNLTVTVVSASNLKAADKSGTSDPYALFSLNGEKVYKTETYKKQLNPVFKNEVFTVPIMRRTNANVAVRVFDWDQIGSDTLIGEGSIPIADLASFSMQQVEVPLTEGKLHLKLKWEPQLLSRKREGTSLLGSTTRIISSGTGLAGDMVGLGVGAGGKVITGGGKIVGGVVGGGTKMVGGAINGGIGAIGRGFGKIGGGGGHSKKDSEVSVTSPISPQSATDPSKLVAAEAQQTGPQSTVGSLASSESTSGRRSVFEGKNINVKITLVGARGLKGMNRDKTSDPYCRVRQGRHTLYKTKYIKKNCQPEWNETFTTKVFGVAALDIVVRDHNKLADTDIGEVSFNVAEYMSEGKSFDGWVPLSPSGTGEVHIQAEIVN
ncbi:C2 domain-containing protein [Sporodiniella umbellata]|nr:C2 domain-containing protein [Sporodiniella umbellata]